MSNDTYERRGVSSTKAGVHKAIAGLDAGLFPGAFCKVLPDYLTKSTKHCLIQHADGAGTKASLAYLVWKETGNLDVWSGIVQDSLVMNLDDMACAGSIGPFVVSLTIERNKKLIPDEVISKIIQSAQELCDWFTRMGIHCHFAGGETADTGDLTRTITINNTVTARMKRKEVLDASRMGPNALIVGFSSTGQASWEHTPNSGISSNGLTNARHDLLSPHYRGYRETYAPEMEMDLVYRGPFRIGDRLPGTHWSAEAALLSPTRTYLPLIRGLLSRLNPSNLLGLIHCSGGGQTKIGKFGAKGTRYIKNALFDVPPLFACIKKESGLSWREMHQCYNMGHRLEAIVTSERDAAFCIQSAEVMGIEAKVVGITSRNKQHPKGRTVVITTPEGGEETYLM